MYRKKGFLMKISNYERNLEKDLKRELNMEENDLLEALINENTPDLKATEDELFEIRQEIFQNMAQKAKLKENFDAQCV